MDQRYKADTYLAQIFIVGVRNLAKRLDLGSSDFVGSTPITDTNLWASIPSVGNQVHPMCVINKLGNYKHN